jgi:SAM-dependent methyltransferase
MRKDYIVDQRLEDGETVFVERFWTEAWERDGGGESEIAKVPRKEEFRHLSRALSELDDGARILDGGCGRGEWTVHLARAGYDVIGLDLSELTVAKLEEKFPEARFAVGDLRQTEFPDAHFDMYFSWGVFEHFEVGLQPCLQEARRILKPGGRLLISVPFDNLRHSLRAAAKTRPQTDSAADLRFYQWRLSRAELTLEMARAGFDIESTRPIHKRQGVLRSLDTEFGLPHRWLATRALSLALSPFVPGGLAGHMLIASGTRHADPAGTESA